MKQSNVLFLAQSAVIAALYALLTYAAAAAGLAYGPVQFRFSEVLTILPVFTPAAIPGLAVGCLLANIASSFAVADMIFGTLATLLAAVISYLARNIRIRGIPLLSALAPVVLNTVIVGLEIAWFFLPEGFTAMGFLLSGLEVGAGELVICVGLGIPFAMLLEKTGAAKRIFRF